MFQKNFDASSATIEVANTDCNYLEASQRLAGANVSQRLLQMLDLGNLIRVATGYLDNRQFNLT